MSVESMIRIADALERIADVLEQQLEMAKPLVLDAGAVLKSEADRVGGDNDA